MTNIFKTISDKFKNTEANGLYYGYYLFGLYTEKPIWDWSKWKECLPLIQPVIDLSLGTPYIKSCQSVPVRYGKDNQLISYNKAALHFGQMPFNEQNNEKWTTKSINLPDWTFFDAEIVFPSFAFCGKNNIDPDIFIKITKENPTNLKQPKINQSIILLFKQQLVTKKELEVIERSINKIDRILNTVLSGKIIRPEVFPSEFLSGAFEDSIRYGSLGVVNYNTLDFSDKFKKYGMKTSKKL